MLLEDCYDKVEKLEKDTAEMLKKIEQLQMTVENLSTYITKIDNKTNTVPYHYRR